VDRWPDLDWSDPWRESLERSRARRGTKPERRRRLPAPGPRTVAAVALLAALIASALARGGASDSPAARADAPNLAAASSGSGSPAGPHGLGGVRPLASGGCPQAAVPDGYVNPLRGAVVKPERIDQGVDYAGSGTLSAIGPARVTYLATADTGWPGAFLEYQLLGGADAGCFVFYAEGVTPVDGLYVGESLSAGQAIATIIPRYPTGIELGWGAGSGTKTYAKITGQWSASDDQDNVASPAGRSFSALIASLGGPPGKVEG
jgi:hypothetical protein